MKALGYGECRWGAGIIVTHSTEEETKAQTGDRLAERPQRQVAAELVLDLVCLTPATLLWEWAFPRQVLTGVPWGPGVQPQWLHKERAGGDLAVGCRRAQERGADQDWHPVPGLLVKNPDA